MYKVLRTDKRLDDIVRHLGYEPVDDSAGQDLITDEELVRQSQERLSKIVTLKDSDLTERQMASLALARAIASRYGYLSGIKAAVIPQASEAVRTAGIYSRGPREIYIGKGQLDRGRDTVDTAAHELASKCLMNKPGELLDPAVFIGTEIKGFYVDDEMVESVRVYLDYCWSIVNEGPVMYWVEKPGL